MKISRVLLALAILAGLGKAPAWATATDLGSANQFGVLSFYGLVDFYPVSQLESVSVSRPRPVPAQLDVRRRRVR